MKKQGWSFLFLFLLCISMIGCEKSRVLAPEKPVTLTLWHNYGAQMKNTMDELVDEFNDTIGAEKGIILSVTSISSSAVLHEKLMMTVNGDPGAPQLPDIATGYPKTAINLATKGLLSDLDKQFTQEELDNFIPSFLDEGRLEDGKLYIFPTAKSTEVLFVNETLFNRFAMETGCRIQDLSTVEGILKTAATYYDWTDQQTNTPNDGKTFFIVDSLFNFTQVGCEQLGDSYFKDNKPDMNSEAFKKIWNLLHKSAVKGHLAIFDGYGSDLAKTGDIICSLGSTAGVLFFSPLVTYEDNFSETVDYAILPYPVFEDGQNIAIQRGGGMFVTKSTEEKEYAASIFLKWFTQPEQNLRFVASTGYLPVTKEAYQKVRQEEIADLSNQSIRELLKTVIDMQQSYTFYLPPSFEGVDQLQSNYEQGFKALAMKDRQLYIKQFSQSK